MKLIIKAITIVCILMLSISSNASALTLENSNIENGAVTQVTNSKEINKFEKLINNEKKELIKEFKTEKIELYEPGVFIFSDIKTTAVVYKIKSNKVSLADGLGNVTFLINNENTSDITYQFMKVTNLEDNKQHILISNNGVIQSDYIANSNTEEFESGWTMSSTNEKIDVNSAEFKKDYTNFLETISQSKNCGDDNTFTTFGVASFTDCMSKCVDNSPIPSFIRYTINTVATVSCFLGPNPVCLLALTQVAAMYTADAVGCVMKCT